MNAFRRSLNRFHVFEFLEECGDRLVGLAVTQ